MKPHTAALIAAHALAATTALAQPVAMEWVTVGNPGNAPDPLNEAGVPGIGAVDYEYRIGKFEVTNAQYAAFLNAVDPMGSNSLALYNSSMAGNFGGIDLQAGNAAGSRFVAQAGRESNPVTYVSWIDAARMANWMTNGQGSGGTESGVYTFDSLNSVVAIFRDLSDPNQVFIPTEDEWYKAAYHDASAGTVGEYFLYATGSNGIPVSDQPADTPAGVNYFNTDFVANGVNDGYAVSGSMSFPSSTNPFTDVGAYFDAASPYGAFDMNGNAFEWNETRLESSVDAGVLSGGSWLSFSNDLLSSARLFFGLASEEPSIGFRLASPVPPPPPCNTADIAPPFGFIDLSDVQAFLIAFGAMEPAADLIPDGNFDLLDVQTFLIDFGSGCP